MGRTPSAREHSVRRDAFVDVAPTLALERILDAGPGSVALVDRRTLAYWFGADAVVASEPRLIESLRRHQP